MSHLQAPSTLGARRETDGETQQPRWAGGWQAGPNAPVTCISMRGSERELWEVPQGLSLGKCFLCSALQWSGPGRALGPPIQVRLSFTLRAGLGDKKQAGMGWQACYAHLFPGVDFLYSQQPKVWTPSIAVLNTHTRLCPLQGRTQLLS